MGLIDSVKIFSNKTVAQVRYFVRVMNYHKLIVSWGGESDISRLVESKESRNIDEIYKYCML